jgi:hypothetical protein
MQRIEIIDEFSFGLSAENWFNAYWRPNEQRGGNQ